METQNKPSSKQEAIIKAYGEHWETVKDYVDENGWLTLYKAIRLDIGKIGSETYQFKGFIKGNPKYCRFLSLQDLEHNNGWIKIESEKQFDEIPNGNYHWFNIETWEYESGDIPVNKYTHYQRSIEPQPPIY